MVLHVRWETASTYQPRVGRRCRSRKPGHVIAGITPVVRLAWDPHSPSGNGPKVIWMDQV